MSSYGFIKELIEKEHTPTPAYVFDLDKMKEFVKKVQSCLGESAQLCYAMKANPFLTGPMMDVVPTFEVCSPGEFRICERVGVPMERIVLSGVYKNPEDMEYVLSTYGGKGVYTVESLQHLQILNDTAVRLGMKITVLIRVTSGNQFGVDEADIRKIISDRTDYPGVEIEGLQFYSGTQKKDLSQMKTELEHLDEFIGELKSESGFEAQVLEYGPGFFVPYFKKDKSEDVENILSEFRALLESLNFRGKVVLEMGRFLAAACGYYVTSIVDMKVNKEQPYVIMDGGINHLNYYGQAMAMKQPYCTQLDTEGNEKTGAHFIRTDLLTAGVLSNLRQVTEYAAKHESRFVKLLIQQNEIGGKRKTAAATKQLEQAQERIAEVSRIIKRLYEDNVNGKISDERFMELSADYEQEQRELKDRAAALQEELSKSQAATVNAEKFMGIVRKHLAFEELTPTLLREMIEKIVVHECSYDENGTRRQDIEIYYSFVGKIDLPEA